VFNQRRNSITYLVAVNLIRLIGKSQQARRGQRGCQKMVIVGATAADA
jgi:hypothetical protein